jgi:hypothetical protein
VTPGRGVINAALAIVLMAAPVAAQSLGDLARQEEARRSSTKKAVKTLSNADLDPSAIVAPAGSAPAEPSCYLSKSKGQCVSADEMVTLSVAGVVSKENAPFEPNWRRDAQDLRSQIETAQKSIATLEAVMADGGRSPGEKKAAEKTLATARQALAGLERRWEKLEKEAANQHIPREWIEPIPVLTKNQPGQ